MARRRSKPTSDTYDLLPIPPEEREQGGLMPHEAWWDENKCVMVIALLQSLKGRDYSCNKKAIDRTYKLWEKYKAERVIFKQIDRNGKTVAEIDIEDLMDLVEGFHPRPGEYGSYYFLSEIDFNVVATRGRGGRGGRPPHGGDGPRYFARNVPR